MQGGIFARLTTIAGSLSAPRATRRLSSLAATDVHIGTIAPDSAITRPAEAVEALVDFCRGRSSLVVLTGAGISTESGIPDYRGENGSYKQGHKPVQHGEFVGEERSRQRYWARSMLGWHPFTRARPNRGHRALARLEAHGLLSELVTQNVDGLHQRAGSQRVLDLHGRVDLVECLDCGAASSRTHFQQALEARNEHWRDVGVVELRADADAALAGVDYSTFVVPECDECGGMLKPNVVFFGGSVCPSVVQRAYEAVDRCDALLVVGSTCSTYSAFRLVDRAAKTGAPVALLNLGPTRMHKAGTPLAVDAQVPCGLALDTLAHELLSRGHA